MLDEGEEGEETEVATGIDGRTVAMKKASDDSGEEEHTDATMGERLANDAEADEAESSEGDDSEDDEDVAEDEDEAEEDVEQPEHIGEDDEQDDEDSGDTRAIDDPYGAAKARARRHPAAAVNSEDGSRSHRKRQKTPSSAKRTKNNPKINMKTAEITATAAPLEPSPRRLRSRSKKKDSGGR